VHHLKPVFVPDQTLKETIGSYIFKNEIDTAKSQHSIYQKGFRCIYANPIPVAAGAMLGVDVTNDALNTLFIAIKDLIHHNYAIDLAFGFANVRIKQNSLKAVFQENLAQTIGNA
jgi:hypothetical protein